MTSYVDYQKQIADLQAKAEKARQEELSGIITQIKTQIEEYKLTAADLGLATKSGRKAVGGTVKIVRFKNGDKTWSGGRGIRPQWVKDIIETEGEAGLEKFRIAS